MAVAGAGAGLSCVLQNLRSVFQWFGEEVKKTSLGLDELERRFGEKEKQTSRARPGFGEKEKRTSRARPGFGEKGKQTSLVLDELVRLESKEKQTSRSQPFLPHLPRRLVFDMKELESILSEIAAVLQDAERRQLSEIAVRDWLRKLKDAVYDAEDAVDKIVAGALPVKTNNRYNATERTLIYSHFMMEGLMIRFRPITNEMNRFHFKEGFVETQPPISMTRQTSSWSYAIESELYARDCEKQKLIDPLINFENKEEVPSVLPVVGVGMGMGGMGKSTLARLVFHDERIIAHFDLRMWVSVTEADSNVPSLVKKILESAVGAYVYHPSSSSSDLVLQTQLQEKLHGKRYLLVLDGVRNEERYKWNRLKACLKCGAMGSRILVTTRSDTVASITGTLPRHDLGRLSEEQSWSLFQKLAKPLPDFLSIGKEMVDRCGGDALAVKTLGGLMFTKTTKEEWESVRSSDFWKPQDNDGGILPALKVSYDHLTSSLKQCFVYCAVFPKGCEIDKNKLIKQWIAHGFIHSDGKNELLEEEGECCFNDLLQRSLFQVKMEGNGIDAKLYKMHDLIHDFLRYVAGNEYFIDESSLEFNPTATRHLVLQNRKWFGQPKNFYTLNNCSTIRSMFLCFPARIEVCLSLGCLRVLDLSFAQIKSLPDSIDELKHLRYLDVSSKWLTELPETMSNLNCLQTLICLGGPLQTLPKEMRRMISLRHIEFDVAKYFLLPSGIGELTCLRTLPKFAVGEGSGCGIEELKCLNQLSGDIRIEGLDNICDGVFAREANLKGKQHLNSLELSWTSVEAVAGTKRKRNEIQTNARKTKAEEVIENLEPHSNLKKLVVEDYPGLSFPSWMMVLSNLVDIRLSHCNGCEHLPPLGQLCFLESLKVEKMSAVKYIVEFDGSHNYKGIFPSLRELYLCDMPNLEGWSSLEEDGHGDDQGIERDGQLIHHHLRHLTIYNCPNMIQLPQLHLLTALECLKMNGVGCARIKLPLSQPLKEVALSNMCNLERCSVQEANGKDNNDQASFRSLHTLSICNCPQLICLPWLCLPALEYLMMSRVGCEKIEFCTSSSLKSVSLDNMPDLEQWSPQKANDDEQAIFPRLKLEVQACPRMVRLPNFLSLVKEMRVYHTNELLLKSVANFTALTFLSIKGISEIMYLPKELGPNHASLRILEISDCPKLLSLSYQLKNLSALKELTIEGCSDLVLSLSDELQEQQQCPPLSTLEVLKIVNSCEKQASLPGDGIVLTSLRELNICSCGSLESLSSDGLQNLTTLTIFDCPRVWSSPEWLMKLRSLSNLTASRCPDMLNLPVSIGNLTSLSKLWIEDWPDLRSLPKSLGNLKLLKTITIANCPRITCFPEGMRHLKNLQEFSIDRCPNLKRLLCGNGRLGEDWPNVARVPNISIDGLNIRDYLSREESSGESEE
ncbi:hypothetical protein MRB53_032249 [Persea americana]|uniref:Uncharacterized protein n=1 Tax=Persea americana TaxID=3435 RepID=A0ACC2KRB3_PERAE|nr:hypothetical protein MRB53_032249 [Persea americana]